MKILALDTATEGCSAALLVEGSVLQREVEVERGHAARILSMIDELLAEAGMSLAACDAIAFGRGPGSFTGVRLAASVTQGLAFGAGLPVLAVSDLSAVAQRASTSDAATRHILVCNDARMQEVYWACFELASDGLVTLVGQEHVGKPVGVELPHGWAGTIVSGAGRGFAAYAELRESMTGRLARIDDRLLPSATEIAILGAADARAGRFLTPEEAVPVYLRDDIARPKS